jgi:hypothetical protein
MAQGGQGAGGAHAADGAHSASGLSDADLEHLVDKVYYLMQSEVRLSRARGQTQPGRGNRTGRG